MHVPPGKGTSLRLDLHEVIPNWSCDTTLQAFSSRPPQAGGKPSESSSKQVPADENPRGLKPPQLQLAEQPKTSVRPELQDGAVSARSVTQHAR